MLTHTLKTSVFISVSDFSRFTLFLNTLTHQFDPAEGFATAALGFGLTVFAATRAWTGFGAVPFVDACAAFGFGAGCFATGFLADVLLAFATNFFGLGLAAVFLVVAAFGSGFFSLNSKTGFGIERS